MTPSVTRMARFMSTVHSNVSSVKSGGILSKTIFNPEYFPRFLVCVGLTSMYAGWKLMDMKRLSDHQSEMEAVMRDHQLRSTGAYLPRRFTIVPSTHIAGSSDNQRRSLMNASE